MVVGLESYNEELKSEVRFAVGRTERMACDTYIGSCNESIYSLEDVDSVRICPACGNRLCWPLFYIRFCLSQAFSSFKAPRKRTAEEHIRK